MHDRQERAETFDELDTSDPTEELVLAELDALTARDHGTAIERHRIALRARAVSPPVARDRASAEELSTSLPIPAAAAYEAFCDAEEIPRWLSVVQSVRVLARTPSGRTQRAAFVGRLQRGTISYTLFYRYSEQALAVSWGADPASTTFIAGRAQFLPLGDRATLMQYQLALDLPAEALPPWADPFFGGHATSVVMNDFREYVLRVHRRLA
jgi:uncharacterized membrane protein